MFNYKLVSNHTGQQAWNVELIFNSKSQNMNWNIEIKQSQFYYRKIIIEEEEYLSCHTSESPFTLPGANISGFKSSIAHGLFLSKISLPTEIPKYSQLTLHTPPNSRLLTFTKAQEWRMLLKRM